MALLLGPAAVRSEVPLQVTTVVSELNGAVGGVAVDKLGYVYVADFGEKVWKISPWGDVKLFAETMYAASGNTIDSEGFLMQSSFQGDRLSRIARDGTVETWATGLAGPVGVIEGDPGVFYVCNCRSNTIARIGADREPVEFAKSELLNCPNGITKDGDGALYVVNYSDGRMLKVDADGAVSLFATIPGGGNGHVVWVGPELYVTAFRGNQVFRVDPDGTVTPVAGTGAFGEQDGAGLEAQFSTPNGIAYDRTRDYLYVNDALLTWPQRFENRMRPTSTVRRLAFPTLNEVAEEALARGSAAEATARLVGYAKSRPGRPYEPILNRLGYTYLTAGRAAAAVAVFAAMTELFPQSFNAWDSRAEGELAAGDREAAILHYRKSLELNPENANAAQKLEEIGAE